MFDKISVLIQIHAANEPRMSIQLLSNFSSSVVEVDHFVEVNECQKYHQSEPCLGTSFSVLVAYICYKTSSFIFRETVAFANYEAVLNCSGCRHF